LQRKKLEAPFIPGLQKISDMREISETLDSLQRHTIEISPWPEYDYVPKVNFSIAHGNDCIFLKYYVSESVVKAEWYKPNDPVFKDSCVEFFVAFGDDKDYYNCEFNVIGTCKFNYGRERGQRKLISEKSISLINYLAIVQNERDQNTRKIIHWELGLMIPVKAFSENQISSLRGKKCRGNFFKCGDDLPEPHFLAWNNIEAPSPDFHVPECFGEIVFE
jgi:hypothetical protein